MTRQIPSAAWFLIVAACVSACQNAPTARKTDPVASPNGGTPAPDTSTDRNLIDPAANYETISKLTREKGNKELVKCVESKGPKMTPEQLKLFAVPEAGMPSEHEFLQETKACPTEKVTATCTTPDQKNPGAYLMVVHGSSAETPEAVAEMARVCAAAAGTWAPVDAVAVGNPPANMAPEGGAPEAGAAVTGAAVTGAAVTGAAVTGAAVTGAAAPAGFSKTLTATYATFLSGVEAQASTLCTMPVGTKLVLTKEHLGSATGPNQRVVEFTAIATCGITKGLITKAHWSGL